MVVGIDPGASAAVALVDRAGAGRPLLLGLWSVYGDWAPWLARADLALMAIQERPDGGSPVVYCEAPTGGGKTRGAKFTPDSWLGLGKRAGALRALAWARGLEVWHDVDQEDWAVALRLPNRKFPAEQRRGDPADGWHRVLEAGQLVEGARENLKEMPHESDAAVERIVCAAEAILIACAAQLAGEQLVARTAKRASHSRAHQTAHHRRSA